MSSPYDIGIIGGGVGGCAAAMVLGRLGFRVVMTEPTAWIGGQLTSQLVPPDEHPWIEEFGCTALYRDFRNRVRAASGGVLNPGGGWVSRICHDPRIAVQVLREMLEPGDLKILLQATPREFRENCLTLDTPAGPTEISAKYWLDATETGDLIALAGLDWTIGAESRQETGEPHAIDGPAEPDAIQAITWCAALGFDPNGDHTIEKPAQYDRWAAYDPPHWTGRLFSLTFPNVRTGEPQTLPAMGDFSWFTYRQIIAGAEPVTCLNWPQNDLMTAPYPGSSQVLEDVRQVTLSLVYWLQTEQGLPGLRLRPDVAGTEDGLAMAPYIRESRRIRALRTLTELDVSAACNPGQSKMREVPDSCGIGAYRIDLHPRGNGRPTVDIDALPFQIPLGCLVPQRESTIIAAAKNIGVTHIANGCTRLHPVEWNIGESAAHLAAYCLNHMVKPQDAAADLVHIRKMQDQMETHGIELSWPDEVHPL